MDLRLTAGSASTSTVTAISSKSYVHRLLIASALSDRPVKVSTNIVSKDMEATMRAVRALCDPAGSQGSDLVIDAGESGSTARFILPLAALLSDGATLTGSGKLPERPMGPLCDVLRSAGVDVSADYLPITVKGAPHAGEYSIAGNVSSQFISGLLFMLPLLEGDSKLDITGELESAAYVDMTLDVIGRFGIRIIRREGGYDIPGGQAYKAPSDLEGDEIVAEGDWSNSAYIMAIGALGCGRAFDGLMVTGLDPDSIQGDSAVVGIFKDFGIDIEKRRNAQTSLFDHTISSGPQRGVDTDCSQIPDLVPALAVVAAFADGDSVFRNISRLRMKECDRIEAVTEMLKVIGVEVDITSENGSEDMIVHGRPSLLNPDREHRASVMQDVHGPGYRISSYNDHRIAMAASAIAFATGEDVVIEDAMAVDKSYPGFYDVIGELGVNVSGV